MGSLGSFFHLSLFFFFPSTTIQPKHVIELFYKTCGGERAQGVRDVAFSSSRRLFTTTRNTAIDSVTLLDAGLGPGRRPGCLELEGQIHHTNKNGL